MGPRRAWHRRWVPAAPAALRAGSGPSSVTGGLHRGSRAAAGGGDGENQGETAGAALRSPGHRKRSLQENRPGGPGAAPGRHRGCGAHGGSAPPPFGEARSASARRWAEGHAFAGGRKEKKLHTCTKNAFSVRGGSEGSRCRCRRAGGGVRAPPPSSRIPAPPHRPRQNRSRAPRGPGGGGRGLPPPRGKIAEIAAPGATGQSPARWGLRTARSRPLFMEESSVHMYLV